MHDAGLVAGVVRYQGGSRCGIVCLPQFRIPPPLLFLLRVGSLDGGGSAALYLLNDVAAMPVTHANDLRFLLVRSSHGVTATPLLYRDASLLALNPLLQALPREDALLHGAVVRIQAQARRRAGATRVAALKRALREAEAAAAAAALEAAAADAEAPCARSGTIAVSRVDVGGQAGVECVSLEEDRRDGGTARVSRGGGRGRHLLDKGPGKCVIPRPAVNTHDMTCRQCWFVNPRHELFYLSVWVRVLRPQRLVFY